MAESSNDSKLPVFITLGFILVGLLIALIGGITRGSIAGGILAAFGAAPACWGMWIGIQQKTQGTLVLSVVCFLAALAVGALLIALRVFHWVV
jgi:hypothetical protein